MISSHLRNAAVICFLVILTVLFYPNRKASAAERGEPAPEIELFEVNGSDFKLSSLRGKVVLVSFWATWCPPCREEMPTMEKSYKKYGKKGFVVVGVNTDTGALGKVNSFIRELDISFPIVLDPKLVSKRAYRVRVMPTNFLIGRDGKVARIVYGALDWSGGPARRVIEELLAEN